MDNLQKIILVIFIIIFIVILDVFLNKCTDNLVDSTTSDLNILKESLLNEDLEKSQEQTKLLNEKWDEYENKLSYFIEHDELEKVSSKIAIISENTINKQYKPALEDVIETTYLLEHIKDKGKLKLKNVF